MKKMGLLMLDTKFIRIPGDIGNDLTFDFPVIKKVVSGATANLVVNDDMSLLVPFIKACQELESEGVSFITTSCGFLAKFQNELSNCVNVPVLTSSLLQIRNIYPLINENQVIGVLTIRKSSLTHKHFIGAHCDNIPKVIYGMEGTSFEQVFMDKDCEYNQSILQQDILNVVSNMVSDNQNIGAIVCECTNMPPFTKALRNQFNIPVFDINTLVNYVYSSIVR